MSARNVGALCTLSVPAIVRSPPQPKSGCARASSGAMRSGSISASASICTGPPGVLAACQAMRLQRSAPPRISARPGCTVARAGPPLHATSMRDVLRLQQGPSGCCAARRDRCCRASRSAGCSCHGRGVAEQAAVCLQRCDGACRGRRRAARPCAAPRLQGLGPGRRQRLRLRAQIERVRTCAALHLPLGGFDRWARRRAGRRQRHAAERQLHVERRVAGAAGLPAALCPVAPSCRPRAARSLQLALRADAGPAPVIWPLALNCAGERRRRRRPVARA